MLIKKIKNSKVPFMFRCQFFSFLVLSFTVWSVAFASGGETSGGADQVIYAETMFSTLKPEVDQVKVCFDKDETFKISDADIVAAVKWAYGTWANYIRTRDITYAAGTGSGGMAMGLSSVHAGCSDADDLHLFLGVTPKTVMPSLSKLRNPLAATDAFQAYQDRDWKKGFIWFAKGDSIDPALHVPIWPSPPRVRRIVNGVTEMEDPNANFKAVLLHEMGHVFGNNHVYSTIMSSRLYSEVIGSMNNQGSAIQPGTLRIDNGLDLIANPGIAEDFKLASEYGDIPLPNGYHTSNPNALKDAYQLLTSFTAHREVTAVAHRARSASYKPGRRADDQNSGPITVEFKDGTEVSQVQIEVLNKVSQKDESSPLFNGQYGNHHRSSGFAFFGLAKTLGGISIPVIVNYNMYERFSVVELTGSTEKPLLKSTYDDIY